MKAVKFALAAILASGAVLSAQEEGTPRYEVGLNYSWLHVNSANQDRQRTGNGGSGSFAYNINNVVGLVADFGGYANTRINDRLLTYMFGPRFSWRHGRLTPYTQFLFGGAYVWNDVDTALDHAERVRHGGWRWFGLYLDQAHRPETDPG